MRKLALAGALLLAFTPESLRAQATNNDPAPLDAWRAHMAERLDTDLAGADAMARAAAPARAADDHPGNDAASAPTDFISAPSPTPHPSGIVTVTQILQSEGLPVSLVGVAALESGFDPAALSPKGALGLWQLMPQTARRFGLEVSARRDDRLDPVKSTFAAASYLKDLYAQFGDWPLALAAYNAGEDRVQQALDRHGARDFWTLSRRSALPGETLRYVPAVLSRMNAAPALRNPAGGALKELSTPARIVFATPFVTPGPLPATVR